MKQVTSQADFSKIEEELLAYWNEHKIFEKSIENRPESKVWNFLDGPPFVTGTPHYGSLLSSIPKDMFGRYWTMMGFRVRRVWGWDGHGLPIENKVENKLQVKRKKDIEEKIGIKKFIEECLYYVNQVSSEWEWYVDHIGRWVDFTNAYKTWDTDYMESVMWVFKQMFERGFIYKGLRVSLYCPHCSTPISNFEVAMDADNYKDVTESATTYKYKLITQGENGKSVENTYLLAWSTTPWNKIVTPALAVNPKLEYVKIKQDGEYYILAEATLKNIKQEMKPEIIERFSGEAIIGSKFEPHYDYYRIEEGKKAFEIIPGDFVTADEGTGIVTIAAYGEEDLAVMQKENVHIQMHVDDEGYIKGDVPKFSGMYYLEANSVVNADLSKRGLVYEDKQYTHSVAHCWRCGTRLFYAPIEAWFVDVQSLKSKLFKNNEIINWYPKHFKYGRFAKSMEAAPDWNISRNRYWGSPVPVWECECGERFVPGSIRELEENSGQKIKNLHKPEIDEVFINCRKCSRKVKRVPEVLDSWIEAGSAPFGERHFPFNEEFKLEDFFPSDFITEYTGQIRAWFYVLHVIATAIYDSHEFNNVLVTGVLLGTDGRKMSKNFGNFPDPKQLMQKYGGDALRIYLMGSPLMRGEDVNFSDDGVPEVVRGYLLILWNSYKYFVDYAKIFNWSCEAPGGDAKKENLTVLDRWILARLTQLVLDLNNNFQKYDTVAITKHLREFIVNDFSTWYIRRSRERVSSNDSEEDRNTCLSVMYGVLVGYSKLLAPLAPFTSEEIYLNLTGDESVHLTDYPKGDRSLLDKILIEDMRVVREIVEKGHSIRKENGIKLRQPLAKLFYGKDFKKLSEELEEVLADELNVKSVVYDEKLKGVDMDLTITKELKDEGQARELIRQVQQIRKESGLTLQDKVKRLGLPEWPLAFESMILKGTNSLNIEKASQISLLEVEK